MSALSPFFFFLGGGGGKFKAMFCPQEQFSVNRDSFMTLKLNKVVMAMYIRF